MPSGIYKRTSNNTKTCFKKGQPSLRRGIVLSIDARQKISSSIKEWHVKNPDISARIKKNLKPGSHTWLGKHFSDKHKKNISASVSGQKNHNWIYDRSMLKQKQQRNDSAYFAWRREVWLRDNFTCKIANPDCSGRIEAHHILGWKSHPELRYKINNGITLCHAHHPRKRDEEAKLSPYFQELVAEVK